MTVASDDEIRRDLEDTIALEIWSRIETSISLDYPLPEYAKLYLSVVYSNLQNLVTEKTSNKDLGIALSNALLMPMRTRKDSIFKAASRIRTRNTFWILFSRYWQRRENKTQFDFNMFDRGPGLDFERVRELRIGGKRQEAIRSELTPEEEEAVFLRWVKDKFVGMRTP